ncbi:MAG: TMEM175 family protein [Ilumatobacteraceae bacterium]
MTDRGLDRLVNFGDAVVAIAITLLVLPLIDIHSAHPQDGLGQLVRRDTFVFVAFFLSFVVIGRLWMVHHELFEAVRAYDATLMRLHLLWLMTIAFLPFPTAMLGVRVSARGASGLYVGTLVLSSLCLSTMRWHVQRTPPLQRTDDDLRAIDGLRNSALFVVAFLAVIIVPGAGLWPMFVLLLDDPLGWWMNRRRARREAAAVPSATRNMDEGQTPPVAPRAGD